MLESVSTPLARIADPGWYAFSRPADLPGVEIMRAENSMRLWRIFHTTYTACAMCAVGGGSVQWRYRGRHYATANGHVMLMEPGELHVTTGGIGVTPGSFNVCFFDPDWVGEMAESAGLGRHPHIAMPENECRELFEAMDRFHRASAAGASLLERQSLLLRSLSLIFIHCCERAPLIPRGIARSALKRARDYLHEHWADNVSLDDLAHVSGLSRFHLLHAFEREYQLPPHAYQVSLRIELVRRLLCAGVPAHAIEAGFADQSHLIRYFKRFYGVTPAQYAAMVCPKGRNIVLYDSAAGWDHGCASSAGVPRTFSAGAVCRHESAPPAPSPAPLARAGAPPPAGSLSGEGGAG